jgi:hypothetical protein
MCLDVSAQGRRVVGAEVYHSKNGRWYNSIQDRPADRIEPTRIFVHTVEALSDEQFARLPILRREQLTILDRFDPSTFLVEVPIERDPFATIDALRKDERIRLAEFSIYMRSTSSFPTTGSPNDPWFTSQGNLTTTGITDVWKYFTTGDSTIVVAVIDSGTQWDHEDLVGNKWISTAYPNGGYDYMDTDNDPFPADSALHGTNVTGVISARTHNSIGLSGVAGGAHNKRGVQIMHLRAGKKAPPPSGGGGSGDCEDVADPDCFNEATSVDSPDEYPHYAIVNALNFAISNGADIINMSFGSINMNTAVSNVIDDIRNYHPNIIMVGAVGNDNSDAIYYPARYDGVLAVGALSSSFAARWLVPNNPMVGISTLVTVK